MPAPSITSSVLKTISVWSFLTSVFVCCESSHRTAGHDRPLLSERRKSLFASFPVDRASIVFLGDSITDEGRWSEFFPSLDVRNRGISADTTADVLQRLHQVTRGKPRAIFLLVGTNDLTKGLAPEDIIDNSRRILTSIGEASPSSRVFVQSLLPRSAAYRNRIEALNVSLAAICEELGHTYIDLYSAFLDSDGSIKNEYSNDEVHLTGLGYRTWQAIIAPYLVD